MRRIVRPDHGQIQNGRNCCKVWLCIAKFVLHDHVHEREEAGHRIVDCSTACVTSCPKVSIVGEQVAPTEIRVKILLLP